MKRVFTPFKAHAANAFVVEQRRTCVDKWYGHLLDLAPLYDWSDENTHEAHKGRKRVPNEVQQELKTLPKVEFCSLWEVDNTTRPRYWHDDKNPPTYDFWTPSALELRTDRWVAKTMVERAEREVPSSLSDKEKDIMLNDIQEECLVEQDDALQRAKKVNWFAYSNMMDILPDPLREKVRLDVFEDLHILDRQMIRGILHDWIPEKYRLDNAPDMRKLSIDSPKHRLAFLDAIQKVEEQLQGEASSPEKKQALEAMCAFYKRQVHPYPHITPEAVKKSNDIAELEKWSRDIFYYSGDSIILDIWARAGEVRKSPETTAFAHQIKAEYDDQVVDFNEEERLFFELFQKSIPLTEKEFLMKQMAENPVLEETLKHSDDIHILEEIEAFYNEHIEAEKAIVDVLVSGAGPTEMVDKLRETGSQSNAHYVGARKYKTLSHELTLLAEKYPEEYASFREKIQAMGNHHSQPAAPFAARVTLGIRLFDSLTDISDQMSVDEM
ncbi:cytochrome C oxidase subunit IV [Diplonema papillatum]|nr:cytochrome C oxidase subunit IV [Diplonema papillatum]